MAGGPQGNEGRLELRPPDGEWGTLCDKNSTAATQACRVPALHDMCSRLGYLAAYRLSLTGQRFDSGAEGPIWSQGVVCPSSRTENLRDRNKPCHLAFGSWNSTGANCDHDSDLALLCITGRSLTSLRLSLLCYYCPNTSLSGSDVANH